MFITRRISCVIVFCTSVAVVKGLSLEPCSDGVFEVVDHATNELTCSDDISRLRPWSWTLTTKETLSFQIGSCRQRFSWILLFSCSTSTSSSSVFHLSRQAENTTVLVISTTVDNYVLSGRSFLNGASVFENSSISCTVGNKVARCTTDFVHPVQNASCSVKFNADTSPWSVVSHCDVSRTFSAMGRYICRLFSSARGETPSPTGLNVSMTTIPIETGNDVSGSCDLTLPLPSSDGLYAFSVEITPGREKFEASFIGTNQIRKPSTAALSHNCPSSVKEGDDVMCLCSANDVGSPPGKVQWTISDTDWLSLSNVAREGRHLFTCRLVWNGQTIKSLTYTLDVIWPPSTSPMHNCPKYTTVGSNLHCNCVTTDAGQPRARFQWDLTGSSVLNISDVSQEDAGKTFTCRMTWNGKVMRVVTYKPQVYRQSYKPSSPLSHTCPPYVIERSNLDCSCVTDDVGNPPATLYWITTNSTRLTRHDVQRDDAGTKFTCQLAWNGSIVTSLDYALSIVSDNDSAEQAHRRGLATGLGSGLAVAAVLAVVVLVSVCLLWRRGWVLPCSAAPNTKETRATVGPRRKAMVHDQQQRTRQSDLLQATAGETSNVYDACDTSQTGVQAPYETLTMQYEPKKTKKRKTKSKGQTNSAITQEDGGATYENVAMQQRH
ncbi:uncharacterized protein [Littorina saxatilis]|uniref:Ig-like domain-containing protein n=1 Tax=Littorina saxatilis TaxID=31220 RepID=A0AAN9BX98_9CAEN